jgi:hypothetical protein
MATTHTTLTWLRRALAPALAAATLTVVLTAGAAQPVNASMTDEAEHEFEEELEGIAGRQRVLTNPKAAIEASFTLESYRPGVVASLRLFSTARNVTLRVFRSGPERIRTKRNDLMFGVEVGSRRVLDTVRAGSTIRVRVGDWPSGLYFARLSTPTARLGFAPFVVSPRRLGEHRVAVVMPTNTWKAYDVRDDDRDGVGDSWYADKQHRTVGIVRPYLSRGVPFRFRVYDLPFLRWLDRTNRRVDVLSDLDLHRATGAELADAYDLIVFPGHHEYVTTAEYDAITAFRNRGGSLAFLSANNFFWRVDRRAGTLVRIAKWRELGRPEASVIGVQYIGNDDGEARGPWVVRKSVHSGWLFEGTGRGPGARFSNGGIEIDSLAPSSPRGTTVVAQISDLLGRGMHGQMTYYETAEGARVFASGAFTLAGAVFQPPVSRLVSNIWRQLAEHERPARVRVSSSRVGGSPSTPAYGWPVRPFFAQHPVRGYFGDPRIGMTPQGVTHTFHFGVDISCPNGTPVYATVTGTVELESFRPEVVSVRGDDGRTELQYWHIAPAVRDGERVVAYRTVIGHVQAPWAHVHFSELRDGRYVNPLRPGAMGPYDDDTTPSVTSLRVEHDGHALTQHVDGQAVDVVVEAHDETPVAVPAPWDAKPVTPALPRWRLLSSSGDVAIPWTTAVDVRYVIPANNRYDAVYARWTRQNKASRHGRYRFYLARALDTRPLAAGVYAVEVAAADTRGNAAVRRFTLDVSAS